VANRHEIDWGCSTCANSSTRRQFLAGLGAAGAASLLPFSLQAQAQAFRIDVHHHFSSPGFVEEVVKRGLGNPNMRKWTPQVSLDEMDSSGTATAVLSITRPGIWFGDAAVAKRLARETNEYGARVVQDHPHRFGLFAILPLPEVDSSLKEIEYALDVLKADGIAMMSSYDDIYLGDPRIAPVMEELNRRKAIVYEHPIREDRDNPQNGIELVTDTTRTINSLLFNTTVLRCPDIKFIFAHGGGTIGAVTGRMGAAARKLPKGLMYELQKFYYDTGQAVNAPLLASYKALAPVSHILFGTDFPLGPGIAATAKGLRENGGFTDSELRAIERENALELIPRLKT
jgi:predicted TIM-barrel fold metal-dependent hydrolase